ncbi:structural protein [Bacillus phage vB_BauM_KLEB27-3]|nr:structural protein [Bacillus phage vB_BauM_KLEB27-3]
MAGSEYEQYVNSRKEDESSSGLGNAIKVGALIGAGALGYRYRRELGSGIRTLGAGAMSVTNRGVARLARSETLKDRISQTGSFLKAMDHALDMKSPVFHLQNRQRFNNRFDDSMRRSLTELEKRKQGVMRRTPTQIEQSLDTLRHNRKMGDFMTERALRFNASMDALNKKMPDRMQGGLRDILNNMSDDFFNDPSKGKIRGLLDSYSPENAKKNNFAFNIPIKSDSEKSQFIDEMFEVLDTFRDTKALRKEDVKASKKKMRDNMYDGFMRQHKKEDTFFTKMMEKQGWKQATVEDLLMHKTGGKMDSGSIRLPKKDGSHFEARMNSKLSKLMKLDPKVGDLIADPNLYVNPRGEMLDLRKAAETTWKGLAGFRDNFQIPFLRFNPLDLMHFTSFQAVKEAPQTYFMRRGTIDVKTGISKNIETVRHPMAHNQDAKVGPLGKEYVYMSGNVYDVGSGDLVETGKYLASGRFGMYPRALSGMANLHRQDYRDRGFLGKLFDVGKQENEAVWSRMASTVTKFKDENWERNYKTLIASGKTEEAYKNVYAMLEQHTTPMSDDTISHISSQVKKAYGKLDIDIENMKSPEEVMTTLGKLNEATMLPNSGVVQNKELSLQINQFWAQYRNNPTEFMKNQRIKTDHMPYVPEALSALDMHETNMIDKLDDVKRLIHQHAIAQVEFANSSSSKVTVGSLVREGIRNGQLETNAMSEVRGLDVLTSMRSYWDDVYKNGPLEKNAALDQFANTVMDESKPFVHALDQTIKEQTPWYSMGTGDSPPQYFGYVGYQTMDKAKGAKWMLENFNKQYQNGESPLKAGVNSLMGVLGQPFAGRKNIQDVTTATLPFYYFAERLDNAISQAGLGLSQQNRGSMQSILLNQFGRRIILPYVAYKQAQYLDDMTGDVVSDKLGETYANMHEDVGRIKEIFGLNKIGEDIASILPGIEQLKEITPIKMFNFATMGAFFDNRSGEEIREYYEDGEDPIRKGRFWGIGSGTPWQGGKIDRFEPNWYRKMKSDYQYTDTMYGSSSEYWANHWMPTLTHPFAPLKHFLLDPNHWANKHKDDRPYPVTGGITELESIPLVGPLLNATAGRIINPTRVDPRLEKSHREYLKEVNEHIKSQYDQATSGGSLQFMPAGGYEIIDGNLGGGEAGSGEGYGYGDGSGTGTGGGDGTPVVTSDDIGGGRGSTGASGDLRASLAIMNKAYSENGGPALGSGGSPIRSITGLNDLRDPDMVSDLKDIGQITDASGIARDAFYSLSEVAGIYGFSVKAATGFEEGGRGTTLENASRMTSYARAWWDLEMGGMGGQLSEIGRRYVPRDPNKRYYNPIRNQMPDWIDKIVQYKLF